MSVINCCDSQKKVSNINNDKSDEYYHYNDSRI